MRIDGKKNSFLSAIETGIYPNNDSWKKDRFSLIKENWKTISYICRKNCYYITESYYNATQRSVDSFKKIITEDNIVNELVYKYNRLFVISTKGHGCYQLSICDEEFSFIGLFTDVCPILYSIKNKHKNDIYVQDSVFEEEQSKHIDKESFFVAYRNGMIYPFLIMEEYATVENKVVSPKCRQRIEQNKLDVLENETRLNITIRNCTWFTTIIRNEDFNVRGHFRLQPVKVDGKETRKLIYIQPFVKHGYHRQASILNK